MCRFSWFLDPGGWGKTTAVRLYFIFPGICTLSLERARSCLRYLVSQLANMEHSFHHILLLEIKSITDAFSSILGPHSRDIFRMSNSFTNIAKLLSRRLENGTAGNGRRKTSTEVGFSEKLGESKTTTEEPESQDHEKLQVKIQAFEDRINAESNTPGSVLKYSLDHISKEEQRNIRFIRSRSLALNTVLTNGMRAGDGEAEERAGIHASISLSEIDPLSHGTGKLPLKRDTHGSQLRISSASHPSIVHIESENVPETVKEHIQEEIPEIATSPVEYQDKLYLHLKENLSKVKAYATEIAKKVPVPDQCTIEAENGPAVIIMCIYLLLLDDVS
ncbi:hypothetical protein STEG23_005333 [Scotinomys teguina]